MHTFSRIKKVSSSFFYSFKAKYGNRWHWCKMCKYWLSTRFLHDFLKFSELRDWWSVVQIVPKICFLKLQLCAINYLRDEPGCRKWSLQEKIFDSLSKCKPWHRKLHLIFFFDQVCVTNRNAPHTLWAGIVFSFHNLFPTQKNGRKLVN